MGEAVDARSVGLCSGPRLRRLLGEMAGKRVTLMGLGLFGGGEGAAQFLVARGAELTITDLRGPERLAAPLKRLSSVPARYRLGGHDLADFAEADLVVANPAVPRTNSHLHVAEDAGVSITSPLNMFLTLCPAPIAAVTGSNGKSTTAAMLAAMLEASGRKVWLGGNIGVSLLPSLSRIGSYDLIVLEMSSFQLADAGALSWSPHVAVVTNVTPNHLSWHGGFEQYATAKRHIVDFQTERDFAVLNGHDAVSQGWLSQGLPGKEIFFAGDGGPGGLRQGMNLFADRLVWREGRQDHVVCHRDEVPVLGYHNVENAMAAATAARCLGADWGSIRKALHSFLGLAHRLELVGEFNGTRFYNDSNSTTPEATVAALAGFAGPRVLIAGGYDKLLDMAPVARAAAASAEVLITLGQTGPALAQKTRQESVCAGRTVVVREVGSLGEAVAAAVELSMPGMVVLFSPACASYDMFENYRERGDAFKSLVKDHFRQGRRSRRA